MTAEQAKLAADQMRRDVLGLCFDCGVALSGSSRAAQRLVVDSSLRVQRAASVCSKCWAIWQHLDMRCRQELDDGC